MNKALKIILSIVLTIVILAALAIGGVWAFAYFKYGVNIFSVAGTLNDINKTVEVSAVAPKQPTSEDMDAAMTAANSSIPGLISKDAEGNYTIQEEAFAPMIQDMTLTDKQACSILNILLKQQGNITIKIGNNNIDLNKYDFQLLQLSFGEVKEDGSVSFNVVSSLSLKSLKDSMTSFPLSIFKSRVPDTVYISSTVKVTKNEGAFNYTVESESLEVNMVKNEKLKEVFKLIGAFTSINDVDTTNKTIGENFVNVLIGNENTDGFAYSLKNAGATDYQFTQTETETLFVVKNLI